MRGNSGELATKSNSSPDACAPRLFISTTVAIAVSVFLPAHLASHAVTRLLLAWNAGTCLCVLLAAVMMIRSSDRRMRHRAQIQDDGQLLILPGSIDPAKHATAELIVRDALAESNGCISCQVVQECFSLPCHLRPSRNQQIDEGLGVLPDADAHRQVTQLRREPDLGHQVAAGAHFAARLQVVRGQLAE